MAARLFLDFLLLHPLKWKTIMAGAVTGVCARLVYISVLNDEGVDRCMRGTHSFLFKDRKFLQVNESLRELIMHIYDNYKCTKNIKAVNHLLCNLCVYLDLLSGIELYTETVQNVPMDTNYTTAHVKEMIEGYILQLSDIEVTTCNSLANSILQSLEDLQALTEDMCHNIHAESSMKLLYIA